MEYDQVMYRYIIITFFTGFNIRQKTYHMLYMVHGTIPQEFGERWIKLTQWKVQLKKKAKFKFKFDKKQNSNSNLTK